MESQSRNKKHENNLTLNVLQHNKIKKKKRENSRRKANETFDYKPEPSNTKAFITAHLRYMVECQDFMMGDLMGN